MTTQPVETGTSLDLELLVGEMPAVPCEHSQHGDPECDHDDGPATHYMRNVCASCGSFGEIKAICQRFTNYVLANGPVRCRECRVPTPARELVHILGPVNG